MVHFRPAGALALAALVATVLPVAAQQQKPDTAKARRDSARTLPPIEVIGSIVPSAAPGVGSNIPARLTTLQGREVEALEPRLLTDVLNQQAGFSTYDDLGSPFKLNLSSRGFFASPVVGLPQGVSIFLDGIRQNEPDAAQVNFDLLPLEHVKRIEILSGNGSLLGRNSLGGAINLITRRGEGPLEGELEVGGGSYGQYSTEGNLAGKTRGGFDYYVGAGFNNEDGWRQATKGRQYNLFVNMGKLEADRGIRLQLIGAKSRVQTAGSLPASVYAVQPDSNLSANDYEDLNNLQAALSGYRQIGTGRASFSTYYRRHRAERFNANQPDDPDVFGTSRNGVFGGTVDYRWGTLLGTLPASFRFGVDGSTSSTRVNLFADSAKFGGGRTETTRVRSPVWDIAGFVAGDVTVGRVNLSLGARYDYVRAPFFNLIDPTRDTTQSWGRLNPRAGVDVELGGGASLFGSWGRAFRAPSVIEVACADPEEPCPLPFALGDDPPIFAVRAETFEGGFRYARGRVMASASAYRTNVRDDIFLFPYDDESEPAGSTIDGFFANIAATRREGVEADIRAALPHGVSLFANYAYTLATFQTEAEVFSLRADEELGIENEAEPGDRLPLVPDHQVKGGISWEVTPKFGLALQGRYIGRQFLRGDEANEDRPLNGYFVADARATVTVGPWTVTGIVNNVFDNTYAVFGTYNINQGNPRGPTVERFLTPGMPIMARLVVKRAFGGAGRED